MRKYLSAILLALSFTAIQNISLAELYPCDYSNNFSYIAYSYDDILAFSTAVDNFKATPSPDAIMLDINTEMSMSKIIDDDFSLEMDLDANAKKQIKPKATVIEGYKYDTKSSKCVEKVMKPHLKKYKVQEEVIGDEIDNIDVDKLTETDIKQEAKKQKSERIAKEKSQKKLQKQSKERIAWFNIFKRKPTEQKIAQVKQKPDLTKDINNSLEPKSKQSTKQTVDTNKLADNSDFDVDNLQSKPSPKQSTINKKEEARIARENLKLAKPEKQKPVKVAKKLEPKPIKPEKVSKPKPSKIAKAKVKPVKIAEAKVKPVKTTEIKPIKVAEAKVKPVKTKEIKPVKVATAKQTSNTNKLAIAQKNITPVINDSIFTNATYNSALGKPVQTKFETIPTDKQISNQIGRRIIIPQPLKTPQKTTVIAKKDVSPQVQQPVKQKVTQPAIVAKAVQTQPNKVQPVVQTQVKTIKTAEVKPVKVAQTTPVQPVAQTQVKTIKTAEVKPVKVAQTTPVKPVVQTQVKPKIIEQQKIATQKPTSTFKPIKVEQKITAPVAKTAAKPAQSEIKPEAPFKPVKVENRELSNITAQKETPAVYNKQERIIPERPVSVVNVPVYNLSKPQEIPVYSAFETMQNRLPRTTKPFDTDDM